jgi:hypothetical protein
MVRCFETGELTRRHFVDLQPAAPFIEELALVEHQPVEAYTRLDLAQARAGHGWLQQPFGIDGVDGLAPTVS